MQLSQVFTLANLNLFLKRQNHINEIKEQNVFNKMYYMLQTLMRKMVSLITEMAFYYRTLQQRGGVVYQMIL